MTWKFKMSGSEDIKKAFKDLEKAMGQDVLLEASQAGISVITKEIKALAGKISQRLANDIDERRRRTRGGKASATTGPRGKTFPIAATMAIEYGSGTHGTRGEKYEIKAEEKLALSFPGQGGRIARRKVQHPGIQATPFMRPGYDRGKGRALSEAMKVLEAKLRRVGK